MRSYIYDEENLNICRKSKKPLRRDLYRIQDTSKVLDEIIEGSHVLRQMKMLTHVRTDPCHPETADKTISYPIQSSL